MNATPTQVGDYSLESLVGVSPWVRSLRNDILRLARHSSTVQITGPSGTGKELIARAIHARSSRARNLLIPVDCAAISGSLFASHMFGHVKGAFTDATHAALGCFRAADGGTIFLDEIGELALDLQAKLLRVLQERVVVPVGSHDGIPVDVRLITATNRDLKREVKEGRFRSDLYYRLTVVKVATLPLRERREDIEHLIRHVLARLAVRHGMRLKVLSTEALDWMHRYEWPGNVRELENVIEQAVLFTDGDVIEARAVRGLLTDCFAEPVGTLDDIASEQQQVWPINADQAAVVAGDQWPSMADVEREHIRLTLERTFGNQSAAARLLKMDRNLLRRKIKRYQIGGSSPRIVAHSLVP